jgi:UDP-2-acetamido-3-amino-2,3-dideoxy-glucuronate N-acetyltransferase
MWFIGEDVTIGAFCFIPEGVTLCDHSWIGPRVTFTNDKYPPSGRDNWQTIKIGRWAVLGAGVLVLPGVEIGESAFIAAGSIVTKNVPVMENWKGSPAMPMVSRLETSPSLGGSRWGEVYSFPSLHHVER